jgi:uncharacterized tellurite resistance protein B-like protein
MHALLESLFKTRKATADTVTPESLRLAAAILLFEVSRADGKLGDDEGEWLLATLASRWQLDEPATRALRDSVHEQATVASDLHQFTHLLRDNWSYEERITLITNMWRLAYVDGVLDPEEEYLIRKVADLLYVSHSDFIRGKVEAIKQATNR